MDNAIFFARGEETRWLASLVAVYRGVMLYGDSGTGKSSLINAGLLPAATELGFRPERVRVQPRSGEELVIERIATSDDDAGEYLPSLLVPDEDASPRVVLSTEAFEQRVREACTGHRPLLIFDQFEEILTLFEEPDAEDVQQQVVQLLVRLLREPLPLKLLFAFREDYLGRVKQLLSAAPELVDQALRLGPPAAGTLPTIIRGPFERYPGHFAHEFDPGLSDRLRAALARRFGAGDLSLSEVQTVCLRLWRADDPQTLLDERGVQGLLEDYLGEALDTFPPDLREASVALLAQMVTAAGTRNVISADDLMQRVRAEENIPRPLLERALDRLESESKLVRRERRRDLYLYEITSEFLVPWISQRRDELRRQQERRRERRRATALLLVAAFLAAIAMWALGQRSAAQKRADEAASLALVAPATAQLESRPDVSLLLALAAYGASQRPEARSAVASAFMTARAQGTVVAILHGHLDVVSNVAFSSSADRRIVASASDDKTIRLWDADTHAQLGSPLAGHEAAVRSVALSSDGTKVASGGEDGIIFLWDLRSHNRIASLTGHESTVRGVAFSPDSKTLASGSDDGTIVLWDIRSRKRRGVLKGHDDFVQSVAFSPNGKTLASASDDKTVRLWDVRSRAPRGTLTGHEGFVLSVAFSPDGTKVASAGDDRTILLWNAGDHRRVGSLTGHESSVRSVAFSPDGRSLASASDDNSVRLWDVTTQSPRRSFTAHTAAVTSVAFGPDGKTLASGSDDSTVRIWDVSGRRPPDSRPKEHADAIHGVAFAPDGRTLASGSDDNTIGLWDVRTHRKLGALSGHEGGVYDVAFSPDPDGRTLASAGADSVVRLWDVRTQRARLLTGHGHSLHSVAFSRGGNTLAAAGSDGAIVLWNARTGRRLGSLTGHKGWVTSVSFNPADDTLASASSDNTIRLWDVRSRKSRASLTGHKGEVTSVVFSRDGGTLASAGEDWTVRLWDVDRRAELDGSPLRSHTAPVLGVALSGDGRTLASADEDGTVRIWDLRNERPRLVSSLSGHGGSAVRAVALSRDGTTLASGADDTLIRLWDDVLWSNFTALRKQACGLVGSDLNPAEWEQYASDVGYRTSGCGSP